MENPHLLRRRKADDEGTAVAGHPALVALLDEAERPVHHGTRFTVAR